MKGVIDHFSYSQLNTYLTCPLRYRLQYVELIPPAFTASALAFGSAVHEAVAAFHHQHLLGDTLRPDQMLDVYRQAWTSRSSEAIRFCNGDNEESLQEKAIQMLTVYQESFDPSVEVLGIEEPFELDLGKRIPPLVGWIDVVEQAPDGTITVADLKTAARKYSENTVHSNVQLTCYSLGAQALGFNGDTRFRLDVLLKTQNPELIRYETTRTKADRERFLKLVKGVWQGIKKEVFFPKEDWQCGQCPFADPCKQW